MKLLIKTFVCLLIFGQLYAQHDLPASKPKHNTKWMKIKTTDQAPATDLAKNKTTFGLDTNDELVLSSTHPDDLGYRHYRYQQTYKGIPIESAIYLMHEKNNRVQHTNGKLIHDLDLSISPTINEDTALQAALSHINATLYAWEDPAHKHSIKQVKNRMDATFFPSGELVIVNVESQQNATYRLAYKFDIYAVEPLTRQIIYVDAGNSQIVKTLEKIHNCTEIPASGTTNYSGNQSFNVCQANGANTLKSSTGVNIQVFSANNQRGFPQIPFADTDNFFDNDPTATEAYWATQKTYEYFLNVHGRNSLDDEGMALYTWVHYGADFNNAFWNGSWMSYGDGDNSVLSAFTSPDMVAHEMTHGITDFSADLIYSQESGALSESFSDIFGEVAERYMRGSNDWLIGADFIISAEKDCLRNMNDPNNPKALNRQPDTYLGDFWYTGIGDRGGVHINSGVQNFWFYLLSEGGSGTNDNGYPYTVDPIGIDKAAAIAYRNLTEYLTPDSQYADARAGAIQAATDLYLVNSNEVQQVMAAWDAVGVGGGVAPPNSNICRQSDSLVLVTFYHSTNGPNWDVEVWDLNQPMETWHGIQLNSEGCITSISLGEDGLSGTIPAELGTLTQLSQIILDENALSGNIPTEIWNLPNLTHLNVSDNLLSGNIPIEIENASSLTYLRLDDNQFSGGIPSEIGNLTNLTHLRLDNNQLSGSIPPEIGNLTNLAFLTVDNNQLDGCYDMNLSNLCPANLYDFDISGGNNFDAVWSDFCLNGAGACTPCRQSDSLALVALYNSTDGPNWDWTWNLNQPMDNWLGVSLNDNGCVIGLNLDENHGVVGSIPPDFGNLTYLKSLKLSENQLPGIFPLAILELTNLEYLKISDVQLFGDIPSEIGNLTNLTHLHLGYNQLSGSIPLEIGNLSNLTFLNLRNNQLTGCYDPALANLCSLNLTNFNVSDGNSLATTWEDFCLNGVGVCPAQPNPCRQRDSLALVALYNATDGPNWTLDTPWNLNQPIDNWESVFLNGDGCVIELAMDRKGLSGNIPPEIGNLTNLLDLSIRENQLSGNIPPEIGNLVNLTHLNLGQNQLSGNIPLEIENLISLTRLDLNRNLLSGNIPPEIGNLVNLTYCDLSTNQLSGNIPPEIEGLNKVTDLYLSANSLSGSIPSELGNLMSLIDLRLGNNQLSSSIPSELGNLISLTRMSLFDNQLSGNIPPEIGNLINLHQLVLAYNQLSGNIPPELEGLNSLLILSLRNNQLTGNIPPEIGNLNTLQNLNLAYNQLSGNIPPEIGNLHSAFLDLTYNQLSGCYYPNLTSLCEKNGNYRISNGNNFDTTWSDFCLNSAGSCTPLAHPCRQRDSLALIALYNNADGPNWGLNTTWDFNQAMDNWEGVFLNSDGCVTELALDGRQLSGNIPPEIGDLSYLMYLDISENYLTGNIPSEIGNLTDLIGLNFSYNQLSGNIPFQVKEMNNMESLYLNNNQLSGSIPPGIGWLDKITYIDFSNNQLNGNIPPEIKSLRHSISLIDISNNQLSGCYHPNLVDICNPNINNAHISDGNGFDVPWEDFCQNGAGTCAITPPNPCRQRDSLALVALYNAMDGPNWYVYNVWDLNQPMYNWQGVFLNNDGCVLRLELDGRGLTGYIPPEIGDLSNLTHLDIGENYLTGSIPPEIGNLNNLESLGLYINQLSGSIPPEIGNLSNLDRLWLDSNNLSGCYDPNLANLCSSLSYSDIDSGNNFDATWEDFCLYNVGNCDNIPTPVWPGDFNNDGIANIQDLLYWGIAEGFTGSARPNATLDWSAQDSQNWALSVNGINSQYQDGNGDGTIDNKDLNALTANYNSMHNYTPLAYGTPTVEYRMKLISSIPNGNIITNTYELHAESSFGIPISTHGLAYAIDFNDLPVVDVRVDVNNSSLMPQEYLDVFDATQNRLDIALTRTDKNNQTLNGSIASIVIDFDDIQVGDAFAIHMNNGSMISADGSHTTIGDATFYGAFISGTSGIDNLSANVSVIHEGCNTFGSATAQVTGGTAPYTYSWSTGETSNQTSNLSSGTYTLTVSDAVGLSTTVPLQINGQVPMYDANGNLLCGSTCPDYLTPSSVASNGLYNASIILDSDATIPTGDHVQFKAGQTIKLDKGFKVQSGASFSGEIEDCN